MQKKIFYHLHIPKTGGTSLNLFLNKTIYPILKSNNIEIYTQNNNIDIIPISHNGWKPINNNIYIISSMRDPVKRCISQYVFLDNFKKNNNFDIANTDINKKTFLEWFYKNENILSNYQLKNLFYCQDGSFYPEELDGNSPEININVLPIEIIKKNLSKINILIKTENITELNLKLMYYKILKDFNIDIKEKYEYKENIKQYVNNKSLDIYNSLTKSEINFIEVINSIELEIYNTESYFTKFEDTPQ